MKFTNQYVLAAATLLLTFGSAQATFATVITNDLGSLSVPLNASKTVSGTLPDNSTALEESFTLTAPSEISAFTTSYATGGFQPNLQLFSSTGTFLANEAFSNGDSSINIDLAAGSYIALLSEFDYQLDPSVTTLTPSAAFIGPFSPGFSDETGATRTGAYSLTVSAVPEPSAFGMAVAPLLGALLLSRCRKRRAVK